MGVDYYQVLGVRIVNPARPCAHSPTSPDALVPRPTSHSSLCSSLVHQVSRDATDAELKKAYRKLAVK
jgi:hypothetical protein